MRTRQPSPAELLQEHVQYEFEMLRGTHAYIGRIDDRVIANALVESFCIHARVLIEFFEKKRGARAFADRTYVPFSGGDETRRKQLARKLNNQVAHVMDSRTGEQAQKVGPQEQSELLALLTTEFENFRAHLLPEYATVRALSSSTIALREDAPRTATNRTTIAQNTNPRTVPLMGDAWKKG